VPGSFKMRRARFKLWQSFLPDVNKFLSAISTYFSTDVSMTHEKIGLWKG
jgi:hypothetical protein